MALYRHLARPYAEAIFATGLAHTTLDQWACMLDALCCAVEEKQVKQLIQDPRYQDQLTDVITELCDGKLNEQGQRLLAMLVEKKRLVVLPDLVVLFKHLRMKSNNEHDASIVSADQLNESAKKNLVEKLEKKLGGKVTATFTTHPGLLGGAVIRVGDEVIDGSLKGQLLQLKERLLTL